MEKPLAVATDAACVPPDGYALVPVGTNTGDVPVWDKAAGKYKVVPYPADPKGEVWTAGTDGPFWAKPGGLGGAEAGPPPRVKGEEQPV